MSELKLCSLPDSAWVLLEGILFQPAADLIRFSVFDVHPSSTGGQQVHKLEAVLIRRSSSQLDEL